MKKYLQKTFLLIFFSHLFFSISSNVYASAFQLFEYSGADVGNFGAGGAAIAEDATTNFTNAAGLVRLPQQIVGSSVIINEHTRFKGIASGGALISLNPLVIMGELQPSHDKGGKTPVVPALHYSGPMNDVVFLGLSITAPFGLETQYDDGNYADPVGYSATSSTIRTLNINPNIAFNLSDQWSIGLGIDAMHVSAVLNSRINLAPSIFADSYARNHAKNWAYGWNAGVLFEPTPMTRFGLSFRSKVIVHLHGKSEIVEGELEPNYSKLKAKLNLPKTWMLSGFHRINPCLDIMATAVYTGWDIVKHLTLRNAIVPTGMGLGTAPSIVTLPQNFDNTWRVALGADYYFNPNWRLRGGIGFDQSPVNNKDRTVRLPDARRTAVAIGARYVFNKSITADFGYTHLFIKNGKINQILPLSITIGKSKNSANLYGFQLTWNIC